MPLVNKLLDDSPPTSTRNRFLEEEPCTSTFKEGISPTKTLDSNLFSVNKCSTKIKILDENTGRKQQRSSTNVKKANRNSLKSCMGEILEESVRLDCDLDLPESDDSGSEESRDDARDSLLKLSSTSIPPGYVSGKEIEEKSHASSVVRLSKRAGAMRSPMLGANQTPQSEFVFGSAPNFGASASGFALQDFSANVPEKILTKFPTYSLKVINLFEENELNLNSCSGSNYQSIFMTPKRKKMQLLNAISMALLFTNNLKNEDDNYRVSLQEAIDDVLPIDPEFILKVALYARQELQIRAVSNFLLAYAAAHQNARMYLEKYFEAAIVLPSDWIQVAEYFQVMCCGQNKQPFPAALRRAMKKCFLKFDKYQLAKYNRDGTKKQKIKEVSVDAFNESDSDNDDNRQLLEAVKKLTLKNLIRTLHIDSPSEHVMCLLEKNYPMNQEEFRSSGLPGVWDPQRAGERMKLPTPETWETCISASGNEPAVWQSLIDNNKLPYMATLRNLKSLILSGISPSHHQKVISNLIKKKAVLNSRQLPMQYYKAYKVLSNLQNLIENGGDPEKDGSRPIPDWKKMRIKKMKEKLQNASISVVEEYKIAINEALEISSMNNLHPIPGKTLIVCQLGAKGFDVTAKSYETSIMMGLMCLKACEDGKMCLFSTVREMNTISLKEEEDFLYAMITICDEYQQERFIRSTSHNTNDELERLLNSYLRPQSMRSLKVDHLIFLQMSEDMDGVISPFLQKYRQLVNPDLLYTHVNFKLRNNSFCRECISEKDVSVCGSSSSLIKFIAERSSGGQLNYVENIDLKYKLPDILESKYSLFLASATGTDDAIYKGLCDTIATEDQSSASSCQSYQPYASSIASEDHMIAAEDHMIEAEDHSIASEDHSILGPLSFPAWRTFRIFISSTFKDMMSERDVLIRYVMPELKRRAASVLAKIVEVDLRWGITEKDSSTKRAAEICLREAQNADIFVGMIGERYGTIFNFESLDDADLDWVKDCPDGLSITELEIKAAAFRKTEKPRAFFYFRDNSFTRHVPKRFIGYFMAEDLNSKAKVDALKQEIRSKNFKILDGYPCHFAGICDQKPVLGGLDVLGNTVLDDLWQTVQEIQENEDPYYEMCECERRQQNFIESNLIKVFIHQKDFSSESIVKQIVSREGIFVIHGAPGCGKTTNLINLDIYLETFTEHILCTAFVGISPKSRDISSVLQFLCKKNCLKLGSSGLDPLPADVRSFFPDFLLEVSNSCGGREITFLIDGLDRLDENDQRLDWLPLFLPKRIRVICSASSTSLAFKVLRDRAQLGSVVSFFEIPLLSQPERVQIVKNYLSYYRKVLDQTAFSNKMLKIVTQTDSPNPFYLQIACDYLRMYGSFGNLESILQTLPSTTELLFHQVILQMENEYGSIPVQTVLALLCITKEGLEDADLHPILSFAIFMKDLRALPPFDELKKKIASLEPENLLSQVQYCSLMSTISTFVYGQFREETFNLVGTEFEKAIETFYRNKNFKSLSKSLHCILAAYYCNACDVTSDGTYKGKSGFAFRSLLHHLFNGGLYKELSELLCNVTFLTAVFLANAGGSLLEYYSSLLGDIFDQNLLQEIDSSLLSSFHGFVSRDFHIFLQYPGLLLQQAVNCRSSLVDLSRFQNKRYLLENLSRTNMVDYRLATLTGFTKNITASAAEKSIDAAVLGTEDGYVKVLDLTARRVVRTIKAHSSKITHICCVGRNKMCVSSNDGTLSVWNTGDFSRISVLRGHRKNVTCCCFEPGGYTLYSSGWDNSVRSWSVTDGRPITVIEDFRCPVNWIDHHPEKQEIACGLWSGNIQIWDTVSIKKKTVMTSSNGSVQSLAYTQDGINIIASYINSQISIWSSEEGIKMSSLKGHIMPVKTFGSLLRGSMVISGSDDCTLKVWSAAHRSHFKSIDEAKFCAINIIEMISENLLAVAFQNGEIWVFDINDGKAISKIDVGSNIISVFLKFTSTDVGLKAFENHLAKKYLIFGTQSGELMMSDILTSSPKRVMRVDSKITAGIHNCEIVVCGTSDGFIGILHPDKKLLCNFHYGHKGSIGTFCFFQENKTLYLLSSGSDNVLKLWKVDSNDLELTIQKQYGNMHKDAVTCAMFCSQLSALSGGWLTGSYDNNIILWCHGPPKVFEGLQSSVLKIAHSGDYILGCGNDGAVVIWHKNGAVLTTVPGINQSSAVLTFHVAEVDSGEFAVTLAYVDLDGSIKISKPLELSYYYSLDGHSKAITSCCGTEQQEIIVSSSLDGCVNLWNHPPKVPTDAHFTHESSVTGLILSAASDFAISSDTRGNVILWKIDLKSPTSPLTYAGKKKYDQGFIKGLSWLKDNKFACAGSQLVENGQERNFLDVFEFGDSPQKTALCLQMKKCYDFASEISCFDTCDRSDVIVVGMKSGNVMYITPEAAHVYKMCDDWILGVCLYSKYKPSDRFCVSSVDGVVKMYSVQNLLSAKESMSEPMQTFEPPHGEIQGSKFTTAMCLGQDFILCGETDGVLRIYDPRDSENNENIKAHEDLISGMCMVGSYLFTSSLDKTIKGWDLKSYEQVCQFHSTTPVSCISAVHTDSIESEQPSTILMFGTTSGKVYLLKFHTE